LSFQDSNQSLSLANLCAEKAIWELMQDENYEGVPNKPPSAREAATTVEQNESWRTQKYDHVIERKILQDLYLSLNPAEK